MLLNNPFRFGGWNGDPQLHDNAVAHWDFNDASTITKVGATERVSQIDDGSVNTNHMTNGSVKGPFIVTVGGRNFGRFDAALQNMLTATHHASLDFGTGDMTYVAVISSEGYADHDGHFLVKGIGGVNSGAWYGRINEAGRGGFIPLFGAFGTEKSVNDYEIGTVTNRVMVITAVFDKSGTDTCRFYKNGVESPNSGFSLSGSGSPDSSEDLLMGRQQPTAGAFGTFDIGESAVMNTALDASEVANMHAYLKNKWSINDDASPGHSPATDPATFAGRIGDWDFSDDSTITEVSSKISQITDLETTNTLLQTTASKRPVKAFFAGKQMGYFGEDGTNSDDLSTEGVTSPTNLADIGSNSVLYVGVCHALRGGLGTDDGNTIFISGQNNVNCARMFAMVNNDLGMNSGVAESSATIDVVDNAEIPRYRTVCYAMYVNRGASPDELSLYFNGVETAASGTDISTIDPLNNVGSAEDGFIIGSLLPDTGGVFANKLRFGGGIGRVIVIEQSLTSAQITAISHFLMNEWDITT